MASRLGQECLKIARSYVGMKEQGRNRGPLIDKFNRTAGVELGSPWCATSASYIIGQACYATGILRPLPGFASCARILQQARELGLVVAPSNCRPGDLFVYVNSDGTGHMGWIASHPTEGKVTTLEGNTNPGGERDGDGFYERRRTVSGFDGVIRV